MQSVKSFSEELEYNARCKSAIDVIKIFIRDAERQLESSIDIKTLKIIIDTVDEKDSEGEN